VQSSAGAAFLLISATRIPEMNRSLLPVLAGVVVLAFSGSVQAQAQITYYDRSKKKEAELTATIAEETAAQIVCKASSGRTEKIPAVDILDVNYMALGDRPAYRRAVAADDKLDAAGTEAEHAKAFDEALSGYQGLLTQVKDNQPAARHLQFRIARLLARRAEEDPSQVEAAAKALGAFIKDNAESWQIGQVGKLLGRLQEQKGDMAGAQKTYKDFADREDLAKETRQEYDLLLIRALLRNGKHALAEQKLKLMEKTVRVQVYLAECQVAAHNYAQAEDALKAVLAGDADAAVKGLAANTLGDCYRQGGKKEEAFWQYLWVDVLYGQDKEQHAKALYYLAKLFDEVKNDPARALQCRDRLQKEKEFIGTDYQKLAAKEK
jgi:hypothetical protein